MAIALMLQFDRMKQNNYDAVMQQLGLKVGSRSPENWPKGILSHTAGQSENGWVVIDVWESQADFDHFMEARLRPAFAKVGNIPEPKVTPVQVYNRYESR